MPVHGNVRLWPKADIPQSLADVRFGPTADRCLRDEVPKRLTSPPKECSELAKESRFVDLRAGLLVRPVGTRTGRA